MIAKIVMTISSIFSSHRLAVLAMTTLLSLNGFHQDTFAQSTPAAPAKTPQPPQVGDIAPDFELTAIDGTKVRLSKQTDKGPVVLVELRGFPGYQCPICTAQVGKLMANAEKFTAAKAQVVLIYPGPAQGLKDHANEFVRGKTMPGNFHLLLDPDFAMTNQYALRWNAKGETSYPSTFVLDTKRKVRYAKISHSHGDRATVEEILAALPK